MRPGEGLPLVGIHADAVEALVRGRLFECAVAGLAAGGKDHVRPTVNGLRGRRGAPFGVGEGLRYLTGMIGGDDVDVRLDGLGARLVALAERHHRWDQVRTEHATDGARLGEVGGQHPRQIAGVILMEDKAGHIGDYLGLELVHADELDVGVLRGHLQGRLTQGKADRDDGVIPRLGELTDVVLIVGGSASLDVVGLRTERRGSLLDALPGRLVEGTVVHAADIRNEPDLQSLGRDCRRFPGSRRSGRRRRGSHAASDQHGQDGEHRNDRHDRSTHGVLPLPQHARASVLGPPPNETQWAPARTNGTIARMPCGTQVSRAT